MALITQEDIEEFTGFSEADFKKGGSVMTESEWAEFCDEVITWVSQLAHRFCNVKDFESHSATEYHNGKGGSMDEYNAWSPTYQESDIRYYPREQPVISVTSVAIDTAGISNAPLWSTLTQRSTVVGGDYEVITQDGFTYIRFHKNIPIAGVKNVKITYTAGYSSGSPELYEIKMCLLKMATNVLLIKKKIQEAVTIRQMGIRDYSQMFEVLNENNILTEDIRAVLGKYRRARIGYEMYV